MAFFRPFLADPFFSAPSHSLLSPSSSLFFDDEPFFSTTPLYLYDSTPASRRRRGRGGVRQQQQQQHQAQLKEQQAGSADNAQAMVSGTPSSDDKDHSATQLTSPHTKQTAVTTTNSDDNNGSNSKRSGAVSRSHAQQSRLLSPLSLLTPFTHAGSLLSSRAVLPSMSVDMMSTDAEYTVHASVPGVAKQDLRVTVDDGVLTIEAERLEETKQSRRQANGSSSNSSKEDNSSSKQQQTATSPSSASSGDTEHSATPAAAAASSDSQPMDTADSDSPQYHHVESYYGHISRSITLPDDCNTDGMMARYEDGVLRIAIPRVQERRQRGTRLEIQ